MPNQIYMAYRDLSEIDLKNSTARNGYELLKVLPGARLIKQGVFPGAFGYPDMHITHLDIETQGSVNGQNVDYYILVIAYTNRELTADERKKIVLDGIDFAVSRGALNPPIDPNWRDNLVNGSLWS